MRSFLSRFFFVVYSICVVLVINIFLCQAYIVGTSWQRVFTSNTNVPYTQNIVVFGGGMKSATEQSDMQEDRVKKGVELWKASPSSTLWFTGDDGAWWGNEIAAMVSLATDLGVPTSSIATDPHGYRTIYSCKRLSKEYGVRSMVAVSQTFHLYRIVFLCSYFNIHTVGVSADMRLYKHGWVAAGPREWGARVKSVVEIFLYSIGWKN